MDKAFWIALGIKVAPIVLPILLGAIYIALLKLMEKRKAWQDYAAFALRMAEQGLGDKLGVRGQHVFEAWLRGLDVIKDGHLSRDEVLDTLMDYAQAMLSDRNQSLSVDENKQVRATATTLVQMLSVNAVPSREQAVRLLSVAH